MQNSHDEVKRITPAEKVSYDVLIVTIINKTSTFVFFQFFSASHVACGRYLETIDKRSQVKKNE